MNVELAAPDRRNDQLPLAERNASSVECAIIICFHSSLRIKLYTFNQLPSCGYPTIPILASHTPPPSTRRTRFTVPLVDAAQIQGNAIY